MEDRALWDEVIFLVGTSRRPMLVGIRAQRDGDHDAALHSLNAAVDAALPMVGVPIEDYGLVAPLAEDVADLASVSYTHLTLPTICSV